MDLRIFLPKDTNYLADMCYMVWWLDGVFEEEYSEEGRKGALLKADASDGPFLAGILSRPQIISQI